MRFGAKIQTVCLVKHFNTAVSINQRENICSDIMWTKLQASTYSREYL